MIIKIFAGQQRPRQRRRRSVRLEKINRHRQLRPAQFMGEFEFEVIDGVR